MHRLSECLFDSEKSSRYRAEKERDRARETDRQRALSIEIDRSCSGHLMIINRPMLIHFYRIKYDDFHYRQPM